MKTFAENEQIQSREYERARSCASSLLGIMAVIFVLTIVFDRESGWVEWVRAFSEAALVGALADWFAVTALFRRPLSLPIPHTAVIPSSKARIGRELGDFVVENFLNGEAIARKIIEKKPSQYLTTFLIDGGARDVAQQIGVVSTHSERSQGEKSAVSFFDGVVHAVNPATLCGGALKDFIAQERWSDVRRQGVVWLGHTLERERGVITAAVSEALPWFVPGVVGDALITQGIDAFQKTLRDLAQRKDHPLLERIDTVTLGLANLLSSESEIAKLLNQSISRSIQRVLAPQCSEGSLIEKVLKALAEGIQARPEIGRQIDTQIAEIVRHVLERKKGSAARFIENTVQSWDPTTFSNKIELQTGRDLQFIRMNGTIVGGLVGLVLHALKLHLP